MEDLSIYFEGSPHTVTIGGVSAPCLLNEPDEVAFAQNGLGQIAPQAVATVIASLFPDVKGADPVTLTTMQPDGSTVARTFSVWRKLRIMDGALIEILLRKA